MSSKYYECPIHEIFCTYWNRKNEMCEMEILTGNSPENECDEYIYYTNISEDNEYDT